MVRKLHALLQNIGQTASKKSISCTGCIYGSIGEKCLLVYILMSLSMVVIAAMIAAGGLGEIVLKGITQMKIGLGFEGGIAVVILAIILDRITQGFGKQKKGK